MKEDKKKEENKKLDIIKLVILTILLIALIVVSIVLIVKRQTNDDEQDDKVLAYTELVKEIQNKNVEKIEMTVGSTTLKVKLKDEEEEKKAIIPNTQVFMELIQSQTLEGNEIKLEQKTRSVISQIPSYFFSILPTAIMVALFIMIYKMQGLGDKGQVYEETERKTKITFDDIAGLDEEKAELKEIVEFLKEPKRFTEMGAKIPKGVLLYGKPGTGKTLIAKAIAGEADVPFISMSGSEFIEMFAGLGASRVRKLFEKARKISPCIVFIDEIDAIGSRRTSNSGAETENNQTLNQLLVEMDGFDTEETIIAKQLKHNVLYYYKENLKKEEKNNIFKAVCFTGIIALIVIGLLCSADNEFAKIFSTIFKDINIFNVSELTGRIIIIIIAFFYFAGFFMNMLDKENGLKEFEKDEKAEKKESYTIRMMITVLNLVYLVFCFTQIKVLFTEQNIKYSEFARKGFFQLMIVSLINIVMILKANNKNLRENEKQDKYKKTMCIVMVIFTLVIIISAFARMTLYQQNYGYTRLRVLVDLTLITEIILLIPTVIYILENKINLIKTYFVIIVTMYCIVNFVNIDKFIVKNNINKIL